MRPTRRTWRGPPTGSRGSGGVTATRVFTRIWLALSGRWSWDDVPVIPPEVIYLPSWFPLNIYDWGCWARQTLVALAVVASFKPSRPLPFDIHELHAAVPGQPPKADQHDLWSVAFNNLDKALHKLEKRVPKRARRAALRRCADWIIARQEADGCWGGIQPPWVYSLHGPAPARVRPGPPGHPEGDRGLDRFTIRDETGRRLEACQSPVWDTVLAMVGLADAGLSPEHPALVTHRRTGCWPRRSARRATGRCAARTPRPAAGRSSSTTTTTPTPTILPR